MRTEPPLILSQSRSEAVLGYCPVCQKYVFVDVIHESEQVTRYECPKHPDAAHRVTWGS